MSWACLLTDPRSLVSGLRGGSEHGMQRLLTFFEGHGIILGNVTNSRTQCNIQAVDVFGPRGSLSSAGVLRVEAVRKVESVQPLGWELTQEVYQREFFTLSHLRRVMRFMRLGITS